MSKTTNKFAPEVRERAGSALWRKAHWLVKWFVISSLCLAALVIAEKTGLWVPDGRPLAPTFDTKACREAMVQEDYPGISIDELAEDIQFQYRQACSQKALEYQGYVD